MYAPYGPHVLDADALARRIRTLEVNAVGIELLRHLDVVDQLPRITSRTLVIVGDLEAGTPVEASQEVFDALAPDIRRWSLLPGVGHFPWLDDPDLFFGALTEFVTSL